jgi:hypothetical protein
LPPREKEIIDWRKKKKESPNGSIGLKLKKKFMY